MSRIGFVFRQPPHGHAGGREGLDAVLASSALTDELAVFFIGDGVYQLLAGQQPAAVQSRDHAATFRLFSLYDIEQVYVCSASLAARGLTAAQLLLPAEVVEPAIWQQHLAACQVRLSF